MMTEVEKMVSELDDLRKLRKDLEFGVETIRNYYMGKPFLRTRSTVLFWSSGHDKPLGHNLQQEFRDFLQKRLDKTDKEIRALESTLKRAGEAVKAQLPPSQKPGRKS